MAKITEIIKLNFEDNEFNISSNFSNKSSELLFFIHGFGCSKESYEQIFNFKEFDEYSILTFDLVGHGESSKPSNFSFSMRDQAKICNQLIEKIQPKKSSYYQPQYGHSNWIIVIGQNIRNTSFFYHH